MYNELTVEVEPQLTYMEVNTMIKKSNMTCQEAVKKFATDENKITVIATLYDYDSNWYIFAKSYNLPKVANLSWMEKFDKQIDSEMYKNENIEAMEDYVICYDGKKFRLLSELHEYLYEYLD